MAQPTGPDWYLHEWFATLGKKQADLWGELGWHKNTSNRIWHGIQPYRRDHVNELSLYLQIQPWELLMHPDDAMAIRRLRKAAFEIAHDSKGDAVDDAPSDRRRAAGS